MNIDFTPHAAQAQIHAALWPAMKGRVVMVIAGRRFGKTVLSILEVIKRAIEIPGSRIWYVAPTKEQAYRIAWRVLLYPRVDKDGRKHPPYLPHNLISKRRDDLHYVELKNGSLIEFLGTQEEIFLLGAGLDFVVLDEFPTIPFSVWFDTIRPMLADRNGDALFIGTVPDPKVHNITTEFLDMYDQILYTPGPEEKAFNFPSFSNPHINRKKIEKDIELLKKKGRENDALRLYFGRYTREYGMIFPKFSREQHVVVPFPIPGDWMRVMAVDPHPQKPTCALWCAIDKRPIPHYWFYREKEFIYEGSGRQMTIMEAAADILTIENAARERVAGRFIDPTFAKIEQKALGQKSVKDIFRDYGLHFREASRDFDTFFHKMTDKLVDEPEPSVHWFNNCINSIRQMEAYSWESWASSRAREERGVKNKPKKVDDDYVDCEKYIMNSNVHPVDIKKVHAFQDELRERWASRQFL